MPVRKRSANKSKLLKVKCPSNCYEARIKDIYVDLGIPDCPVCNEEMIVGG